MGGGLKKKKKKKKLNICVTVLEAAIFFLLKGEKDADPSNWLKGLKKKKKNKINK